jgi:parallel beta-helix repeat protein
MKGKLLSVLIAVLLLTIVFSGCLEENKKTLTVQSKTIYVDGSGGKDHTSIQDAIDAAKPGDKLYVYSGMYNEDIATNKSINLIGENKYTTIINGSLNIYLNYLNISGFTIQNGGITTHSDYNSISNNIIINNWDGIYLYSSNNNTISGNTITNNSNGIDFYSSSNNAISGNIIINNDYGIRTITYCNNNVISENIISNNNKDGIHFWGPCNNNVISKNIISNNSEDGIYTHDSSASISENTIKNNSRYGIFLEYSLSNTLSGNTISNNNCTGIYLFGYSSGNIIYHNNLINNTPNANDTGYNIWDNTTLKEGNYWDDYNGTDEGGDDIGDTHYSITGGNNQDFYPLMNPLINSTNGIENYVGQKVIVIGTLECNPDPPHQVW